MPEHLTEILKMLMLIGFEDQMCTQDEVVLWQHPDLPPLNYQSTVSKI